MSSLLPSNPSIERLKKESQALCKQCKAGNVGAMQRVRQSLALFRFQSDSQISETIKLSHAQDVIAREYGFAHWSALSAFATVERANHQALNAAMMDPRMNDLTFRAGIARGKGLPEIGTEKISEHGVRYAVTDYAPALSSRGGQRVRKGGPPNHIDDLMPVIAFPEMSELLYELYIETDCTTARPLVFVDTLPDSPHAIGLPGFHQVLVSASLPELYFLLDASRIHETILAHELGHIWVEMVERIEDYRHPKDQSDLPKITQFYHIQSFVMDLRVNDMLERRGFDMSIIAGHQVETIHNFAAKFVAGEKAGNVRILAGIISSLAGALLEMERFPAKLSCGVKTSLELIERHLPEAFEPAKGFVASVLRHGYDSCEAVKQVVNACCAISFAATGDSFNPENDLVEIPHEEPPWDKHPGFLSKLPRSNKREMFRRAAQYGVTGLAKYEVITSGREHATISLSAPLLPEPVRFGLSLDLPLQMNSMLGAPIHQTQIGSAYVPPPGMPYNVNRHSFEPAPFDPYRGLPDNVREVFRADEARRQAQFPRPGAVSPADNWQAPSPNALFETPGFPSHASIDNWTGQPFGVGTDSSGYPDPFAEQKEKVRRQNEELERKRQEDLQRRRSEQMIMLERQYDSANGADLLPALTEGGEDYARLRPRKALPARTNPRNYMAGVGLFLSRAGFEEQMAGESAYGYANNNPVTFIAPDGRRAMRAGRPRHHRPKSGVWLCWPKSSDPHMFISTAKCGAWEFLGKWWLVPFGITHMNPWAYSGGEGFGSRDRRADFICGCVPGWINNADPHLLPVDPQKPNGPHIPGAPTSDYNCMLLSTDPSAEAKVCKCIELAKRTQINYGPGYVCQTWVEDCLGSLWPLWDTPTVPCPECPEAR